MCLCCAGCREWPAYRQWIMRTIETSLVAWFGNVEVVRDGDSVFSTDGRYIFGYHPHGLFPIGANLCLRIALHCGLFLFS